MTGTGLAARGTGLARGLAAALVLMVAAPPALAGPDRSSARRVADDVVLVTVKAYGSSGCARLSAPVSGAPRGAAPAARREAHVIAFVTTPPGDVTCTMIAPLLTASARLRLPARVRTINLTVMAPDDRILKTETLRVR